MKIPQTSQTFTYTNLIYLIILQFHASQDFAFVAAVFIFHITISFFSACKTIPHPAHVLFFFFSLPSGGDTKLFSLELHLLCLKKEKKKERVKLGDLGCGQQIFHAFTTGGKTNLRKDGGALTLFTAVEECRR